MNSIKPEMNFIKPEMNSIKPEIQKIERKLCDKSSIWQYTDINYIIGPATNNNPYPECDKQTDRIAGENIKKGKGNLVFPRRTLPNGLTYNQCNPSTISNINTTAAAWGPDNVVITIPSNCSKMSGPVQNSTRTSRTSRTPMTPRTPSKSRTPSKTRTPMTSRAPSKTRTPITPRAPRAPSKTRTPMTPRAPSKTRTPMTPRAPRAPSKTRTPMTPRAPSK